MERVFPWVLKGVEQVPYNCNLHNSTWKRRNSVRQWIFFSGNLSVWLSFSACTKAKWSHPRAFLYILHCAQNTRSRVMRSKFWKEKFQSYKELYCHFSLDIIPSDQHCHSNEAIICEPNMHEARPTCKAASIIWALGDEDKSDRIAPSHEDESQYNSCGKTETWKTWTALWKSRDTLGFENRTTQGFLEKEILRKKEGLEHKVLIKQQRNTSLRKEPNKTRKAGKCFWAKLSEKTSKGQTCK